MSVRDYPDLQPSGPTVLLNEWTPEKLSTDQPPATGEWTIQEYANTNAAYVLCNGEKVNSRAIPYDSATELIAAHKSAIIAHEEAWVKVLQNIANEYAQDMLAAKFELDAERARTFEAQQSALKEGIRSGEIEQQLAAERKKTRIAEDAFAMSHNFLLAAQAAIAEHNKLFGTDPRMSAYEIKVDLSALDKHVAAQTKPLVDALMDMRGYDPGRVDRALVKVNLDAKTDRV